VRRDLPVTPLLQRYINHFTILVNGSLKVKLCPVNLNEHLINAESVAVALASSSQSLSIFRTKLIAPQANGFIADGDAPLRHQVFNVFKVFKVFNVKVTQVESMLSRTAH